VAYSSRYNWDSSANGAQGWAKDGNNGTHTPARTTPGLNGTTGALTLAVTGLTTGVFQQVQAKHDGAWSVSLAGNWLKMRARQTAGTVGAWEWQFFWQINASPWTIYESAWATFAALDTDYTSEAEFASVSPASGNMGTFGVRIRTSNTASTSATFVLDEVEQGTPDSSVVVAPLPAVADHATAGPSVIAGGALTVAADAAVARAAVAAPFVVGGSGIPKLYRNGNQLRQGSPTGPRWYGRGFNYNEQVVSPSANGFSIHISPAVGSADMRAIVDWGFNHARLIIDMHWWTNDALYRQQVTETVDGFADLGVYVNLSLYSRQAIVGDNRMLSALPADGGTWWGAFATYWRDYTNVVFSIMNEYTAGRYLDPTVAEVQAWAANYQPGINAIRAAGCDHHIICGGLSWAKTFYNALNYLPVDTLPVPNLGFAFHNYKDAPWGVGAIETQPGTAGGAVDGWEDTIRPVANVWPMWVEELGQMNGVGESVGDGSYYGTILPYAERHFAGWTIWAVRYGFGMSHAQAGGVPRGGGGQALYTHMQQVAPPGETTIVVAPTWRSATAATAGPAVVQTSVAVAPGAAVARAGGGAPSIVTAGAGGGVLVAPPHAVAFGATRQPVVVAVPGLTGSGRARARPATPRGQARARVKR
jgi:hypothetical protein